MTEVVTGEAVILEIPCARFPSRALALAIDVSIQFALLFALTIAVAMTGAGGALDAASGSALTVTAVVMTLVGYPVIWETATRGRSPGKFALGLRVVSDDGSPERFRQALVRGLASILDFWLFPFLGVPALVTSLISVKGKRLGDLFAGTYVIQQRLPARRAAAALAVPPQLAHWAATLEMSGLTEQTAESARRYLARWADLRPAAQAHLGAQLAAAVSAQVTPPPPPGTPAPVYLSAVLAERRRREQARWRTPGTGAPGPAWDGAPWEGAAGAAPTRAGAGDGSASGGVPSDPPVRRAGGFAPPA